MTLTVFEKRLQRANPRLRIKRYGTSMAGIFLGNEYVLRVPQGEIHPYNVTERRVDKAADVATPLNPDGVYVWSKLVKRGRNEVAKMLHSRQIISYDDVARISK